MVLSGDTLYGSASGGGEAGCGTLFKVNTNGQGFAVLHSFNGNDGRSPKGGLVLSGHTLYGTTQGGGPNEGTVFKVNTDGTGFVTLHLFTPATLAASNSTLTWFKWTNTGGSHPTSGVVLSGNVLYGTAWAGGAEGSGTVFRLNTDGAGFAVLHHFSEAALVQNPRRFTNSDGADPESGLVLSGDTLYGTACLGGVNGQGTLFKLGANGTGFTVLKTFPQIGSGANSYEGNPRGLFLSGDTLYGRPSDNPNLDSGRELFKVNLDGTGFTTLPLFPNRDETGPVSGLAPSGASFMERP